MKNNKILQNPIETPLTEEKSIPLTLVYIMY